jgi:hypothetical protein
MEQCYINDQPQETLDAFIDELAGDMVSLKACSLVGRRWFWRSRKHLFQRVRFSSMGGSESLRNWSAVMSTGSTAFTQTRFLMTHGEVQPRCRRRFYYVPSHIATQGSVDDSSDTGPILLPLSVVRQGREFNSLLFLVRDIQSTFTPVALPQSHPECPEIMFTSPNSESRLPLTVRFNLRKPPRDHD